MKVVGVAGAAHFLVLVGRPARAACAYERSQGPGTGRGVMRPARWWWAFRTSLDGGGFSAESLLLRRAPLGGRGMAEPDGVGKRPRVEECGGCSRLWITRLRPRMTENVS
ncbi:hypothetical protein B0H14DRAFT_2679475 [Mycena olivaceomarginata]|nr:hypothetical protein B0H14DRAFT_2679475 [Mycena olivaceomarginata]